MGTTLYWLIGLGLAMSLYGVYRLVFLKKPKPPLHPPHYYTFKIESE